jgi:hypothetical protein
MTQKIRKTHSIPPSGRLQEVTGDIGAKPPLGILTPPHRNKRWPATGCDRSSDGARCRNTPPSPVCAMRRAERSRFGASRSSAPFMALRCSEKGFGFLLLRPDNWPEPLHLPALPEGSSPDAAPPIASRRAWVEPSAIRSGCCMLFPVRAITEPSPDHSVDSTIFRRPPIPSAGAASGAK